MKNWFLIISGSLMLFTALLHTIGGEITLVQPMLQSNLIDQEKTELLGVWHMVTILLWTSGFIILKNGLKLNTAHIFTLRFLAHNCLLFGFAFIIVSLLNRVHAPQYFLFLPIAFFLYVGLRKNNQS